MNLYNTITDSEEYVLQPTTKCGINEKKVKYEMISTSLLDISVTFLKIIEVYINDKKYLPLLCL